MFKAILLSTVLSVSSSGTYHNWLPTSSVSSTKDHSLIGKKALLTFPEMQAEVSYLSNTSLHWKSIKKDGKIMEGSETIFYQQISDHLYFLNWIEQSGLTVSQIIDTKKGVVKSFWSFNDAKSEKGNRSSKFLDASFKFIL